MFVYVLINMAESKPYKIYRRERGLLVTLPISEARQLGISDGDFVTWTLDRDQLIVRKARNQ